MPRSVMFYVQHLLGIGHLMRAAALARRMADDGIDVTLVSGGERVPLLDGSGLEVAQLPPCRATDKSFKVLLDERGREIDDAWRARRRERLLEIFAAVRPDVLMVELFPFGRRQFRFELVPLLEAARRSRPRTPTVTSVRDILVEKNKPERNLEMVEAVNAHIDLVLVHGDPSVIPFEATFPFATSIRDRIRYTGYVVDQDRLKRRQGTAGQDEVLVSAGGGGVGEPLLRAAIAARPMTSLRDLRWRLLAGDTLPGAAFAAIQAAAPDGVTVERARPDFVTLLSNCRLSISQGGYNTVIETLAAGARAVVVPYAGGEESEQTLRAGLLARRGLVGVVSERDLSAGSLAHAIERALEASRPAASGIDLSGTATTATMIRELLEERQKAHQM